MIDLTLRMDYADVFDFDRFHEAFRQMLASAKGDECIKLESWIESRPDLWKNYDVILSSKIASVLEVEVYDQYELSSDPDDNIFIPKAKKEEPHKQPVQTIRGLVKDFLEAHPEEPQKLLDILAYVNLHNKKPTTRRNLQSSLCQDKEVFIHFDNETWGLCSIPYDGDMKRIKGRYLKGRKKGEDGYFYDPNAHKVCEDISTVYGAVQTELRTQDFELRYSTKREHKPTEFFTKALSNSSTLDLGL